jgi:hypothetical protein
LHDFLDDPELLFELELLDEFELELLDEFELELLELLELEFEFELLKATASAAPRSPRAGCEGCPAAGAAAATETTMPVAPSFAAWLVHRLEVVMRASLGAAREAGMSRR